jgi:hypothetical protein
MDVTNRGKLLSGKLKMGSMVPFYGPSSLMACSFVNTPKFFGANRISSPE